MTTNQNRKRNQIIKIYKNPNREGNSSQLYEFMNNVFDNFYKDFDGIITLDNYPGIENLFYYPLGFEKSKSPQFRYIPDSKMQGYLERTTLNTLYNYIEEKELRDFYPRWIVFDYTNIERPFSSDELKKNLKKYEKIGYKIKDVINFSRCCYLGQKSEIIVGEHILTKGKKLEEIAEKSGLKELDIKETYISLLESHSLMSYIQRLKDSRELNDNPPSGTELLWEKPKERYTFSGGF